MAEIVISIASKVTELLVVPIGKHILYPFKYKSNMKELTKQVEMLTEVRDWVQHSVGEAIRQGDEIETDVEKWLNSVDEFTNVVVKPIIDDQVKPGKLCSIGCCPNLMSRYSLSKKAAKTTEKGVDLWGEGKFQKVSHRLPFQRTTSTLIRGYEDFDSRKSVFNDLMEALMDSDVNLIGVYGMGGVGKTVLVTRVVAQAIKDKLFDVVAMAYVTETPDIKNIQEQIADELGLIFLEESISGRAARLRNRLKQEKRVLLVLDNIWAKLDLEAVGIPLGEEEERSALQAEARKGRNDDQIRQCKILLTSRNKRVLHDDMNTQKNFLVEILSKEEAETLFWKIVGDLEEKPDFDPVAVGIVQCCAGLPVAIATIASALKNKSLFDWKDALAQLRRSYPRHIKGMDAHVYSTIKLSYDFLGSVEAKSLFLLCSLWDASYNISFDYLLRCCMGLGLFQHVSTLEQERNRLHTLINILKSSCLLLDGNKCEDVKMHHIIHAIAVSFASTEKLMFKIQDAAGWKEMLEKKLPKDSAAVSLLYRDISELPEKLEFPKLELFLLNMEDASVQIPDAFFEGTNSLRVLGINGIHLLSPPSSLCCLKNLHTLSLDCCQLGNVAVIGELKELEILSFRKSDIEQLPIEIRELTRLRLLDLSDCSKLKVIKPNVISSLTRLEELYMGNGFVQWDIDGQSNASIAELKRLTCLTVLDIHIPNAQIIPQDLSFEKLERFRIFIGEVWDWSGKYEISRTVKLELSSRNYLSNGIKSLLNRTESVYLDKMKGGSNVVYELDGEGFPQLKHLHVQNASEIRYIANSTGEGLSIVFPRLESLFLNNLLNLEKICYGQLAVMSFSKLRIVKVERCDRLKYLFSFSMAKNLFQLQEIELTDCNKLEEIFFEESKEQDHQNESLQKIEFIQLRTLTLECLPQLTSFASFTSVFSQNVVLPNLENLKLSSINIGCLSLDHFRVVSSCYQTLTSLTLEDCSGNLKFLFSYSSAKSLVLLQKLEIRNCKSIEGIINTEEFGEDGTMIQMIFPKLINLQLKGLLELIQFGSGNSVEFPSLTQLSIEDCPKFKTFFSALMSGDVKQSNKVEEMNCQDDIYPLFTEKVLLPNLENLKLSSINIGCLRLDQLRVVSSCCQTLTSLTLEDCSGNLKFLFSYSSFESLVLLQKLEMRNCKSIEGIINTEEFGEDGRMIQMIFPKLVNLQLKGLLELIQFGSGNSVEFPSLTQLSIEDCPKFKTFFSALMSGDVKQSNEVEEMNYQDDIYPLFNEKVGFPSLEKMVISGMDNLESIWHSQFLGDSFYNLKSVEVNNCQELMTIFPSCICERLLRLESLTVKSCGSVIEIFDLRGINLKEKHSIQTIPQLRELYVDHMPNLKHIWNEDPKGMLSFEKLEKVAVFLCPNLENLFPASVAKSLLNLDSLKVSDCGVKHLVPSFVSFQNLTTLEVLKCNGLVNLMVVSIAKSQVQLTRFTRLTRLKITECKMMEEIITHGQVVEMKDKITFKQLKYLELYCLPRLASFCSENYTIECPSLQQVIVRQCPNMKIFSQGALSTPRLHKLEDEEFWEGSLNTTIQKMFKVMVGFRGMENLTLSEFPHLKEVWHNQFPVSLFRNLKSLVVDNDCSSLRYIFIPSVALELVQLQELKVTNCAILEAIIVIEEERADNTLFPHLNRLELKDLPKLSRFCNFAGNSIKLPSLTQLWIDNCSNMETFIFDSIDADIPTSKENFHKDIQPFFDEKAGFPSLERMVISGMDNLESIWHNKFLGDSFYKLKSVVVNECQKLMTIFPSCICGRLLSLEYLTVKSCGSVEEIFDLQGLIVKEKYSIQTTPQLRELYVDHMSNLKHIWNEDPKGMLSYRKLEKVTVFLCPNLEYLFPASAAKSLLNLDSLEVSDCGVKEIIAKGGGVKEAADRFLFPKLNSLQLHNLPQLRTFYPGHTVEGPCLKRLGLHQCDQVKLFISEFLGFYETIEEGQHDLSPPFFLVREVEGMNHSSPNFEELQLSGKAITMEWPDQVPGHVFHSLKSLELNEHESTILPLDFIQRFDSLGKLSLNSSSYKEIFSYGVVKEHPQIKHLVLSGLTDLKQIWKQGSKIHLNFQNLKILEVRSCFNLINLMPSSTSFQNLMILEVWGCDGLKNLLTSSTAKSLVLLKKLEVFDCKILTEVVANEGDVPEEIVFRNLKSLSLVYLQSLARFCSTKHILNFPILESLVVNECPR